MGSSLVLTGGAAVAKTLKESISLTSHGFTVGDIIRYNPSGSPKSYVKAQANSAENAEVLGIVNAIADVNTFELTYGGYIDLPQFAGVSFPVMFLSGVCAGGLTSSPPSALGTVVKPVVTRHPTLNGFVMNNYLGTQIGGSSTIGIDEIQPVGTIMPFAGNAIPDTWLACDGASYDVGLYTELYNKLCYTTNARTPMYGYVVEISLSSGSGAIWNAIAVGDALITNSTSATPTPASYEIIGRVLSKTASLSGLYPLTVQIFPNYSPTNKNFVYPDKIPLASTGTVKAYSTGTGDPYYGVANGTDRGAAGTINTVKIIAFNAPDLRGRVGVGTLSTNIGEWESDPLISAISGNYPPGSFGGEEKHSLTTGEMPSHKHSSTVYGTLTAVVARTPGAGEVQVNFGAAASALTGFSDIGTTGDNTPHNNMPPYLAVRYIIKAKPYTRAAIIDGFDLPYSNLLVRSTDSNSLRSELLSGASGGDLVFYTNSGEASKTGTERMRILSSGRVGLNTTAPDAELHIQSNLSGAHPNSGLYIQQGTGTSRSEWQLLSSVAAGVTAFQIIDRVNNIRRGIFKTDGSVSLGGGINDDSGSTATLTLTSVGDVGIGTTVPGAFLDVNGTMKVGDFGGSTNVMVKATNAAGVVGQIIPLFTWGGNVHPQSSQQRNHTAPIPSGTWLVVLNGNGDNASADENATFVMAQTWVVPSGKYLVFAHSDAYTIIASSTTSGVAWKLINAADVGLYRTANNDFSPDKITSANGWNNISKSNGTAQLINEQNADTATGGDKSAYGCVYQGDKWNVTCQIHGYAIRIA